MPMTRLNGVFSEGGYYHDASHGMIWDMGYIYLRDRMWWDFGGIWDKIPPNPTKSIPYPTETNDTNLMKYVSLLSQK